MAHIWHFLISTLALGLAPACGIFTKEFKLSKVTTGIKCFGSARHTSTNIASTIAKAIRNLCKDFDCLKILTTDSTANMVKMRLRS